MKQRIRDGLSKLPPLLDTGVSGHVGCDSHLVVRGYPLNDLARNVCFEEMFHLALYQRLPTRQELRGFSGILEERGAAIPEIGSRVLGAFKGDEDPLDVITSCLAAISATTKSPVRRPEQYLIETAISVMSFYSSILSNFIAKRTLAGMSEVSDDRLGFSESFIVRCFGEKSSSDKAGYLDRLLVLASEQGLTASTFAARTAASTRADFFSSVIAAVQTWSGYRHGAASEHAYRDLLSIVERDGDVEGFASSKRVEGIPMFGFGHRRYKKSRDPRIEVLASLAKHAVDEFGGTLSGAAQSAVSYFENGKRKFANPDLYVAILLEALGFSSREAPAVVFMGRLAGVSAHVLEENGPMRPMLRGESLYTGDPERPVVPICSRGFGEESE